MSLVVTGTDTGVGKTLVSALLLLRYRRTGVRYWKPVATGAAEGSDTATIHRLVNHAALPEQYTFRPPVSPHLAARRAGRPIDPARIVRAFRAHAATRVGPILVEGIGGALVPLNDRGYLFADLVRSLQLQAVVVARSTLGTINHTLLTLEALRRRRVPVAGVILDGPANRENSRAIERFGGTEVVGHVRPLKGMTPRALAGAARSADPRRSLAHLFA